MLGGLFKRKDRRGRGPSDEVDDVEKLSDQLARGSPHPTNLSESLPLDQQAKTSPQGRPQRQTSKLQKTPPPGMAPRVLSPHGRRDVISPKPSTAEQQNTFTPPPNRAPPSVAQINIPRAFEEPRQPISNDTLPVEELTSEPAPEEPVPVESPKESRRGMFSPIKDALLSSSPSSSEPRPEKVKKAKQRMPMDEFDSDTSPDTEEQADPMLQNPEPVLEQEREAQHEIPEEAINERLSESPVQVTAAAGQHQIDSPLNAQQLAKSAPQDRSLNLQQQPPQSELTPLSHPPPLMNDTSSAEEPSTTSPVSPVSSSSLVEHPAEADRTTSQREETPASTTQSSTHTSAPAWDDAKLRAYFEDNRDIRDLLLLVHDKSHLRPAPPNHPIAQNLFKEENRRLGEMEKQLDGLLGRVLERKRGRVTPVR